MTMCIDIYSIESMGKRLNGNTYPGRGIVLGQSADGKSAVFAYPTKRLVLLVSVWYSILQ